MKFSLPFKLGISVVALFVALMAVMLTWTPMKLHYYSSLARSGDKGDRVRGIDGLLGMGKKGEGELLKIFSGGAEAVGFLKGYWGNVNGLIQTEEFTGRPIHLAAVRGYPDVIRFFISRGANANDRDDYGRTPLFFAKNRDITRTLIAMGADPCARDTADNVTVLHYTKSPEVIEFLIAKGVDVNITGDRSHVPLHYQTYYGRKNIVELLIRKGADVNARDGDGDTPLQTAAHWDKKEIAELLIANGAKLNSPGLSGETPLHWAARHGNPAIIKLLIEKGADLNIDDNVFETPLHEAAAGGRMEVVKLLVTAGAEVNGVNNGSQTPFNSATASGHSDIAKYLFEHGGRPNGKRSKGQIPEISPKNIVPSKFPSKRTWERISGPRGARRPR
jgi:cytohesin